LGHLQYLFAAFAITWVGIGLYLWTLRRDAQRLRSELADFGAADASAL
jgi:CcmD family protein